MAIRRIVTRNIEDYSNRFFCWIFFVLNAFVWFPCSLVALFCMFVFVWCSTVILHLFAFFVLLIRLFANLLMLISSVCLFLFVCCFFFCLIVVMLICYFHITACLFIYLFFVCLISALMDLFGLFVLCANMSRVKRKPTMWFLIRSDTNRVYKHC